MATEAGELESISEKEVQDETGDLRCAQIHKLPEYTNKQLEVLKEHSNESEIKGGETDSAALQSSQMIGQYPPYEATTATSESSTLSESSKDQSSHSVAVGKIDSPEGEVFVEAPPRVQIPLEDICNHSNAGVHRENPINTEKERLESGNMLQKDQKDELEEEKDVTVPKNSSSEEYFIDASLYIAAVTNVPLEEKLQRNDFGNEHPVKKSDEHIFESTGANKNTEKADVLGEEKTSTGIHEISVAKQYRDLENLGDKVDDKQLEKSTDLEHEKKDFEAIKDKDKSETRESTENLSLNPERLPLIEDLGETGSQKEDEENDRVDNLSGPLSEEQRDKDDQRVSMENYYEQEEIIGIVSSNETSQSQNISSVEDKEEKLEESTFLAPEGKILESLGNTEKVSEILYGKTSVHASVKELSNLKLSAEESVLEDEMSSDKVKKESFKEQEPIQRARVIIIEMETCKEETHTEMDPCKCTSQMKKESEESNFIEDSMADKDAVCSSLVSTEKSPEIIYARENIENKDLDERKQDGQIDVSISKKTEVPGIQNDQVITMTHNETYNVLYEENDLQANDDDMDAGDDLTKGENLYEQTKAKSEEEKFEKACKVVEALDTRETVTAISLDVPYVVSADDIVQDQETTHSRNEKEDEAQEEEETNYGNIDAFASSQLTDAIQSLNEEKEAPKFEEISEIVQDRDRCHEKVLNQDDLKAQTTMYDMLEVSKTQNEEGIQEQENRDGLDIDKIERGFEEKHVEAIAETKPSNHIKTSEKGHAQEAVSLDIKEHADETINNGTLGPERIKDETDNAKVENDFIVVSKEVEVTEGIANTEKENTDSKLPMNTEETPKDDEAMCEKIEKAAAELIHEYQTIMTNNLNETGISIEKNDNSEENVGDLPVAQKLEEETIQVCENMDHIKQELEPENVEKASKSTSRHQSQMTIADTEATDIDNSGDGVSMDKTLGASSTIQALILGNSEKVTNPEETEEKICEKITENLGHDKHLEVSLEEEAQKDIHKKIEENKRMEDIIPEDKQIDETKAGLCSNEEQMEGKKLEGDELKQGNKIYEAVVNREICLKENPIVGAPKNVQEDDKWGNKLEKPSNEISVKITMAQDSASNKEDVEEEGSPEDTEESFQEKGEVSVTLQQTIDRLDTEDSSHKPCGKDEKTSSIIGQNGDAEHAMVNDEAQNDSNVDIYDTHELAGQYIDDLEGRKHEEVSNSAYENQIDKCVDTKGNKAVEDHEKASQKHEVISLPEDKNREITCENEATKIEDLNTNYNLNNMISEMINTNGDNETSKSMDKEFLEKKIKDTPYSHSLATQKIHDAAEEKHESESIIESEEQIHQTTSNEDNIDTDICQEKTDSDRLDFISESVPEDQSGESDAPKVDNLADDDKLKIPALGDLNDDHETAKVEYESILEKSMDTISDGHASVLEKIYGRVDEKHKAPNSMSEEQIHQATNTEENKPVAVYNENIDIKRLEIVVKSGPEDQSPDKMTSKVEQTFDEDMIDNTVNPLCNSQALIKDKLQEEENPTVYAESTGLHKSTDHSISEEDKSSDSKSSGLSLDWSAERPILKEETSNDAILGSSLKHNVIENACELESEEKQDEEPEEKETSDTVLEESPSMVSDALERSFKNMSGKQMKWEKEASENKASLSTECDFVEEGFQEDKEETKMVDVAPESAYRNKSNETNEVDTSDDDQSHEARCLGKESEDNENAEIKDEESTKKGLSDTPVTSALSSEAASGSLHRGQRESITTEEETIRNMKSDQEAASDLASVEQNLEEIIKTDLANIDILDKDKCNLVAQYMESEVVNSKDEEHISKTDGNLTTMPILAKEVRWEIEEKHEKYVNYEEQIHERSVTDNNMDNDTLKEDKNIEEIERGPVRVSEKQSHEGTSRTGIIENETLEGALSASQNFDEEKTSKIAFLSEGNEHSRETEEVCKKVICTLLKESKTIVEEASGTSMQSEVEADELNEAHTSVFNQNFESLDPEKNQEEETPTRERASDACSGTHYNLVSVEPVLAARSENMEDLTIEEWKAAKIMDKEVKDSVLASHEIYETTAETKSTEIELMDDALTVKKTSVEENMQKDAYCVGSEDHIHDATEDNETTEWVALENRNREEIEDSKTLQSKKMEDEKQEERKETQVDMEISEAIYPSECNNESSEEEGTLNKGSEETLEVLELEKPLDAYNIMEASEFTDLFAPNKEDPQVERSLQAKEMKDEKQEAGYKIQSKKKISEADNTNKSNMESSEEKRISERGAEKQKPDDMELEYLLNVVPEGLEVAYQTENTNSNGQEKEVTDGSLEAGFHKKEDKALEDIVIELDVIDHSKEPTHDFDATEGVLEQEKVLKVVNFSATKEGQIKMVGNSSIKSDLVEEIKDLEPSGSHIQKESVEPQVLEAEEKFESISFEEVPEKNEKLDVGSQNDANEEMQLEEASNMVSDRLLTDGLSEKTETKITSEDVEAPDVAHVRDKPFHEQIQGDGNKTEIKKPETKWELEEIDTIENEMLNDKVKEPGYTPPKKNHAKMKSSEKIETTSPLDEEEPTKNVEFSSITTASSSEIMQNVSENLDMESVPKESTQIDAKTKVMGIEFDEEGPIKIEKFEHIATNSVFVDRTCNRNSMTSDANEEGEEAIGQEKVDEWDDSLAAFIEDKDNSQNTPIKQATEVTISAEAKEMIWQTEGKAHEKVSGFGNSENEKNKQSNQDDLPVSQFLMDRILQQEGDRLAEACDVKCEDKLQENIHDQKNDVNISKQERNSVSLSVEQVKDDTNISEGKVEDLIKIEGSSDLVQESHDLKKDTENAILKNDESPDRNLHDTSLTMTASEDVKDELSHLANKQLTNIISDNDMELVSAEECSSESKVDVDESKKQDNIVPIPTPEMMTESIIQKDDESLKKNNDVATVIKSFEEDTLKKEDGKESPEISQDTAENDKASSETSEEQTSSVAEPVGNAKGEIQVKEIVSNIQGDQPGKSLQSSSIEDSTLGEALETQSGGINIETRKENQDGIAESKMKDVNNNLSEELKVSDSHKVQKSEPIVEPTNETVLAGKGFVAERSPTVTADEKQAKATADGPMKEEKTDEKEEEDENKNEQSGHDAAAVVEAKNVDVKPAHKKSHNILSGVGSKVKHSIAKVKKAITGKSSHSKTHF